jgi:hypothetical protein
MTRHLSHIRLTEARTFIGELSYYQTTSLSWGLPKCRLDSHGDLVNGSLAWDASENAPVVVVLNQRSSLVSVQPEAVANDLLGVVGATTVKKSGDEGLVIKLHEKHALQWLPEIHQQ